MVDNTSFAGEKECITYAKAGGALTVIAYPDAKGVCESFGGTYANETGIVSWVPGSRPSGPAPTRVLTTRSARL